MDVTEAIRKRKSVRAYETKPIPADVLNRVLEAGRLAPSAVNRQPWHFVVVTEPEKRKELSKAPFAGHIREAPVTIVGCGDMKTSPRWHVVDTTIAMQQIVLAATAEGLGTCWIGSFNEDKVKQLLKIPDNMRVIALLSLGFPRNSLDLASKLLRTRSRRDLAEIASRDEFGRAYAGTLSSVVESSSQ